MDDSIELVVLGVGAGKTMAYEGECSSSFLILWNTKPILLVDIGLGVVRNCVRYCGEIPSNIYVSHNHTDHAGELPICLAVESAKGRKLQVFSHKNVSSKLQLHRCAESLGKLNVNWIMCEDDQEIELISQLSMKLIKSMHEELCYGFVLYLISSNSIYLPRYFNQQPILGFSGDSGYSELLYDKIFEAKTVLIDAR